MPIGFEMFFDVIIVLSISDLIDIYSSSQSKSLHLHICALNIHMNIHEISKTVCELIIDIIVLGFIFQSS